MPEVNGTLSELAKLAAPCFSCGTCSAACPWALARDGATPIRKIIRQVQLGQVSSDDIWLCATCKSCEASCPRGVPLTLIMKGLREMAWKKNQIPKGLSSVAWSLYFGGNPLQRPPSERFLWAKDLKLKIYDSTCEILLYVGCDAAYDRRIQKIARALICLLEEAEVSFGVLGEKEPCCGEAMVSLGQKAYAQEIAQANAKMFQDLGVKTMVALSPHCFDMFKNHYLKDGRWKLEDGSCEVLHYTGYLADLIEKKRLVFKERLPLSVTYHDPCYLGRANGEYEAPRKILKAIPGVELVEMENNREAATCCGGGGGRMFLETSSQERFANWRVKEALAVQARILATSCPFCVACLEDSAKLLNAELEVMDVAEIVAAAIDPRRFSCKSAGLTAKDIEEIEEFFLRGQTSG